MNQNPAPETASTSCPACGQPLSSDGDLLRCAEHGEFFRYGPRLLVHVPRRPEPQASLDPWQTLRERATS